MTNGSLYCNRCGAGNAAQAKFCSNCGTRFEAAAAAGLQEATPEQPQVPLTQALFYSPPVPAIRYAGFWIRFVAAVIDGVAVGIVTGPVSLVIGAITGLAGRAVAIPDPGMQLAAFLITVAFSATVSWIYEASLESSSYQATLGKMALGLKVTDLEGRRISFARATGRRFSKWISGLTFLLGYIAAGFTARKQALHDLIAGTLVIRAM